jgi:hypothetical protein
VTGQLVGPLPVEVFVERASSRLVLRRTDGHGEYAFSILDPTGAFMAMRPVMPQEPALLSTPRPAKARKPAAPAPTHCGAPGCGRTLVQAAPTERRKGGRPRKFCDRRCQQGSRATHTVVEQPAPESRLLKRMDEQLRRGAA